MRDLLGDEPVDAVSADRDTSNTVGARCLMMYQRDSTASPVRVFKATEISSWDSFLRLIDRNRASSSSVQKFAEETGTWSELGALRNLLRRDLIASSKRFGK